VRSVRGVLAGIVMFLVAGTFVFGLHAVADAETLPGCGYPDPTVCAPDAPTDTSSQVQERTVVTKGETLPFTGSDVTVIALVGGLLVVLGAMSWYVARHPFEDGDQL